LSPLLGRSRDERCQPAAVGAWDLRAEAVESVDPAEQTLTPALSGSHARLLDVCGFSPARELRFDGRRIDVAHQAPDELQLAAACLSLGEAPRIDDRFDELFGERQGFQPGGAQIHEGFSQLLKGVHRLLAPGLGDRRGRVIGT